MSVRSRLGVLQLPLAGFGLLVVAWAVSQLLTLPPSPPDSDGFVEGLAIFFLAASGFVGFVFVALGLAIPPGDNFGIRFTRWQRRLFVGAAIAALGSVVVPLAAWPLLASTGFGPDTAFVTGVGLSAVAVLALVGGLGWRTAEAIAPRIRRRR